jgi:zinc-binding alcohol dehydrogenase/oxidoreductase
MRAWLLDDPRGPSGYRFGEIAARPLGPSDVRVELRASALNHLDLWVAHGMPRPPSFPHIAGADGAGEIVEVGESIEDLRTGAEVVIDPATSCGRCAACLRGDVPFCDSFGVVGEHRWGTHAEMVVVPAANVAPKPERLGWDEAAAFGLVTSSAIRMARRGRLAAGERVLVIGVGGGSATAAFLVAVARGAEVFVTSTSPDKRTWALEHGAAGAFDTKGAYEQEIRGATDGAGVDLAIDNVGTATFERTIASLAKGGRLVTNGSSSGRTFELHLPSFFWRQLEVIGASMNDHREFGEALKLVEGGLDVPVDESFAFDEFPGALARLETGDQLGKLVLAR